MTLLKYTAVDAATELIQRAVQEHSPAAWVPLFSGGHDSVCACHVAYMTPGSQRPFTVYHIDTGIGSKYTRSYVEDRCEQFGWTLDVVRSPDQAKDSYEAFVRDRGFPGSGRHGWVYARIKERAVHALAVSLAKGQRPAMFISGSRRQESQRRMGYAVAVRRGDGIMASGHLRNPSRLWVAPCIEWVPADQKRYMEEYSIPRNRIKDLIGLSGECFCGAFAREDGTADGELAAIKEHAPDVYEEIMRLSEIARECGKPDKWGQKPDGEEPECPLFDGAMELCASCAK